MSLDTETKMSIAPVAFSTDQQQNKMNTKYLVNTCSPSVKVLRIYLYICMYVDMCIIHLRRLKNCMSYLHLLKGAFVGTEQVINTR